MADILSTCCGVFVVHCVKLILRIFESGVLLFDCFVYRQNVTCLKRFTKWLAVADPWGGAIVPPPLEWSLKSFFGNQFSQYSRVS